MKQPEGMGLAIAPLQEIRAQIGILAIREDNVAIFDDKPILVLHVAQVQPGSTAPLTEMTAPSGHAPASA